MNGGRVSHSWCKCVVSNVYGGLGGGWMKLVDDMHAGQIQGSVRVS